MCAPTTLHLSNKLTDGCEVRDFRTEDRVDNGDDFDFGLHLQDEARGTGCILSQSPNAMQNKSADQGQIQPIFAEDSIAGNGVAPTR